MSVRSKALAGGVEGGSGGTVRYTVPAGFVTIVKSVVVSNTAASFNRFYLERTNGATSFGFMLVGLAAFGGVDESKQLLPWIVLEPGDSLKTDALHANIYYLISGAELVL